MSTLYILSLFLLLWKGPVTMKLSSIVALATSAVVTLLSGSAEAQSALPGYTPVTGAIGVTNNVIRRLPLEYLASDRPDIFNMFLLGLVCPPCILCCNVSC